MRTYSSKMEVANQAVDDEIKKMKERFEQLKVGEAYTTEELEQILGRSGEPLLDFLLGRVKFEKMGDKLKLVKKSWQAGLK